MNYRQLGQSSLHVSEIGFGCMSLQNSDTQQDIRILRKAYEEGINYFDTADFYGYGSNEQLVGQAISTFRKDIILASKVGNRWDAITGAKSWDVSKTYIIQAIENSLRRLNTDYLDLYQIHGGTIDDNFEEVVETLSHLVQVGKIRYFGISSIRPNVFSRYINESAIVSNMMQYSLLDTRPEEFLSMFGQSQVSVIARGSLAQGLLVDKASQEYLQYTKEEVSIVQAHLLKLAGKFDVSPITLALQYVLKNPSVASALVGIRTHQQLQDILDAYKQLPIVPKDMWDNISLTTIHYKDHR